MMPASIASRKFRGNIMLSHTTSIGAAMRILDHGFAGTGIGYEPGANFIIGENAIYEGWIARPEIVMTFSWWGYLPLNGEGAARSQDNCLYHHYVGDIYISKCDKNMLLFDNFLIIGDAWQEFPVGRWGRWININKKKACRNFFSSRIGTRVGVRHR
jgi:hypothetical protein